MGVEVGSAVGVEVKLGCGVEEGSGVDVGWGNKELQPVRSKMISMNGGRGERDDIRIPLSIPSPCKVVKHPAEKPEWFFRLPFRFRDKKHVQIGQMKFE